MLTFIIVIWILSRIFRPRYGWRRFLGPLFLGSLFFGPFFGPTRRPPMGPRHHGGPGGYGGFSGPGQGGFGGPGGWF